jgi:hypothetical protein
VALFNEILTGRFNRAFQKFFGIKGGAPTPQLSTEIQPGIGMFWGAECRYLESWDRFGAFFSQPAGGAGNFSQVRLRNPAGSNVVAVFEKILYTNSNAAADSCQMTIASQSADLTTGVAMTANRFDNRGRPNPTLIASRGTPATITANQFAANVLANTFYEMILDSIHELTLLPGDAITVGNGIANAIAQVSFWWRERGLEEGERF